MEGDIFEVDIFNLELVLVHSRAISCLVKLAYCEFNGFTHEEDVLVLIK